MQNETDTSSENNLTESSMLNTIVELNRSSIDDDTSTSSLNLLSNEQQQLQDQHIEDSSSPHSSISSTDAGKF